MVRPRRAILVLALTCLCGAQARGQTLQLTPAEREWLAAHPQITLGPYSNYAPAQFVDGDGVHRGLAADYVALIEQILGIEFTNVYTDTWQEILDKAKARQIDVIALIAETPDRTEYLSFTSSYLDLPAVIIARDDVDQRLSPEDLAGMRVGVVQGYAVHDYLKDHYPQLMLDPVPNTWTGLRKLSFGMSDVFISDLSVASHYIDEEGITNLRVVGESGFVYRMGFACRNDWPQLTAILERALAAIGPEERDAIHGRWITLSHETEFASRRALNILGGSVVAIVAVVVAVLAWNRTLQRRVKRTTRNLEAELAERRRLTAVRACS